jgi:hypothetical protein
LLFSAVVGAQFQNLANAQFNPLPTKPDETAPSISVTSPKQNGKYNTSDIALNFTVTKPESWFASNVMYGVFGEVKFIQYNLDGTQNENISANDIPWGDYETPLERTLNFSMKLSGLSEGLHTLIVGAEAASHYYSVEKEEQLVNTVVGDSSEINFTIDTLPPEITIVSIENGQTFSNTVSLSSVVSETVTWIGYSLDGQDAVTVSGNATLTDLLNGEHNVTVFAQDNAGNVGASETIHFTIVKPEETPFPTTLVIAASAVLLAIVGMGLLVYWRKRKRKFVV